MDDYAVFEEVMLERVGVTCARCGTTVTYDLSEDLAVKQLTCSYCERVLLDVVDTCIDPDRGFPRQYSWLTLYKWLRSQAKENTIRFYFPRGQRRPREGPDKIFEELCSAGAQLQR
jgi:DNA-directed RNA polymerase subunit RPC12/RpoP